MIRKQKKHVLASVSEIPRNNDELNEALKVLFHCIYQVLILFYTHLPCLYHVFIILYKHLPCFDITL